MEVLLEKIFLLLHNPGEVLLGILLILLFVWARNKFKVTNKIVLNLSKITEKISDSFDRYSLEFKTDVDNELKEIVEHIEEYVREDFIDIRNCLMKHLLSESLKRHCHNKDNIKKFLMQTISKKIIGTTQIKLLEEGYSKNITLKLEKIDNLLFPFFVDKIEVLIETYLKLDIKIESNKSIMVDSIFSVIEVVETRYLKTLEDLIKN